MNSRMRKDRPGTLRRGSELCPAARRTARVAALALGVSIVTGACGAQTPAAAQERYAAFGYAWENNDLGLERVVPRPWTDIALRDGAAEIWGRRYDLGNGLLPRQITSQGQPLFAAAPAIVLRAGGIVESFGGPYETVEQAADRVVWRAETTAAGYTLRSTRLLEYDGLLRFDIELVPDRTVRIEELALRIPFTRAAALFFSRFLDYDFDTQRFDRQSFAVSQGRLDRPQQMGFNPAVWVGNHDVGLEWVCETDFGWTPRQPAAITFEPVGDAVVMTVRVVSAPLSTDQPYRLTFALYATPAKPLPADWRQIRLFGGGFDPAGLPDPTRNRIYVEPRFQLPMPFPGLPIIGDAAPAGERGARSGRRRDDVLSRIRDAGARLIPYGALYGMPARLPAGEWKDYSPLWRTDHPTGEVRSERWAEQMGLPARQPARIYISLEPKSFQDFLVWQYAQAIDNHGIDGLYFDLSGPNRLSTNPLHPNAEHVRSGGLHYPFFRQRELMKRLYVMAKSRKPDFLITQHHSKVPAVVSGFSDVILSGEALNAFFQADGWTRQRHTQDPLLYQPDYGTLPRELYETQYAQTRGFVNMLLPQIIKFDNGAFLRRQHPDLLDAWTYSLVSRAALYDIPLHDTRLNSDVHGQVLTAHERFGWLVDVRYVGPWAAEAYLQGSSGGVDAAIYLKPAGNRMLLVLANLGDAAAERSVDVNRAALAAAGVVLPARLRVTDAVTGSVMEIGPGRPIRLAPDRFRLLIIEPADG